LSSLRGLESIEKTKRGGRYVPSQRLKKIGEKPPKVKGPRYATKEPSLADSGGKGIAL